MEVTPHEKAAAIKTALSEDGSRPPDDEPPDNRATLTTLRRAAMMCSAAVVIFGLLGLLGWALRLQRLASLRMEYVPMAPSTALAFILLGSALFLHAYAPFRRFSRALGMIAAP